MFKPLDHVECVDNEGQPKLVVGAFYSVKQVWVNPSEVWHVEVYGHDGVMFPNHCFEAIKRPPTTADFERGFVTIN